MCNGTSHVWAPRGTVIRNRPSPTNRSNPAPPLGARTACQSTDRALEDETRRLERIIERHGDLEEAVRSAMARLSRVPRHDVARKPLVGVVGEIYVRNNLFANEDVLTKKGQKVSTIPKTWDEFIKFAKDMTVYKGNEISEWGFTFMGCQQITDLALYQKGSWSTLTPSAATGRRPASVAAGSPVTPIPSAKIKGRERLLPSVVASPATRIETEAVMPSADAEMFAVP